MPDNTPEDPVQLTQEETEEVAMALGHILIATTAEYCHQMGLSMADPNTQQLVRVVLMGLLKTLPGSEQAPEAKA
jgi:hypothetical protein